MRSKAKSGTQASSSKPAGTRLDTTSTRLRRGRLVLWFAHRDDSASGLVADVRAAGHKVTLVTAAERVRMLLDSVRYDAMVIGPTDDAATVVETVRLGDLIRPCRVVILSDQACSVRCDVMLNATPSSQDLLAVLEL